MRRLTIAAVVLAIATAAVPARAGVVSDLLALLGIVPVPSPGGVTPDNCDTGECEQQ